VRMWECGILEMWKFGNVEMNRGFADLRGFRIADLRIYADFADFRLNVAY